MHMIVWYRNLQGGFVLFPLHTWFVFQKSFEIRKPYCRSWETDGRVMRTNVIHEKRQSVRELSGLLGVRNSNGRSEGAWVRRRVKRSDDISHNWHGLRRLWQESLKEVRNWGNGAWGNSIGPVVGDWVATTLAILNSLWARGDSEKEGVHVNKAIDQSWLLRFRR